tara:strand:+ start:112 stop:426 length:315 start_codon:yes stop_codon:yes gene_type:complete
MSKHPFFIFRGKKGNFGEISKLFTALASIAIILVVIFIVFAQGRSQIEEVEGTCTVATGVGCGLMYNATADLQGSYDDIPSYMPIIIIVGIGIILLGLVKRFTQ